MKIVTTLFALSAALFLMGAFAQMAAALAQLGSPWANTVGFAGIGIGALAFFVTSVAIWRAA